MQAVGHGPPPNRVTGTTPFIHAHLLSDTNPYGFLVTHTDADFNGDMDLDLDRDP